MNPNKGKVKWAVISGSPIESDPYWKRNTIHSNDHKHIVDKVFSSKEVANAYADKEQKLAGQYECYVRKFNPRTDK